MSVANRLNGDRSSDEMPPISIYNKNKKKYLQEGMYWVMKQFENNLNGRLDDPNEL